MISLIYSAGFTARAAPPAVHCKSLPPQTNFIKGPNLFSEPSMNLALLFTFMLGALALPEDYYYSSCMEAAEPNLAITQLVEGIDPEDYVTMYGTFCQDRDVLLTVFDCIKMSADLSTEMGYKHAKRKVKTSYQAMAAYCKLYYETPKVVSFEEIQAAWEAAPKPFVNYTYANETGTLPFSIPKELIIPTIPGSQDEGDNNYYSDRYSEWTLYYVVICVGLAAVFNFLTWLMPKGAELAANNPFGRFIRRFISMPPMWNDSLARWVHFHSSRLPCLEIFGYFVMNTVMMSVNYRYHEGFYESRSQAIGYMVGYRTGIMVMYKLPFLFFFAGRNNFLIQITGWDYTVFNMWHRWLARIATLDVLVHWAGYSVGVGSYLGEEWRMWYWIAGVIATLIMIIMIVQGSVWLRRRAYELFLYTHFIWAIAFLVFTWYHVIWYEYPMEPMYACFAVWGYDRVARLVRIAISGACTAELSIGADGVIVADIRNKNPVRAYPGSHVFVYFLVPRIFYQSHPFTAVKTETGLRLYIKSWNGATRRIRDQIVNEGGFLKMKVLVEGPYGVPLNLKAFDHLVCVAGGIGITSIYSHLSTRIFSGDVAQKVTLHWVVRHEEFLSTFSDDIKKFIDSGINVIIHVTGHSSLISSPEGSISNHSESLQKEKTIHEISSQNFEIEQGRPDLRILIPDLIRDAKGSTAFLTCGPPGMIRDVRSAVSSNLMATKHYVQYYEEGFEM